AQESFIGEQDQNAFESPLAQAVRIRDEMEAASAATQPNRASGNQGRVAAHQEAAHLDRAGIPQAVAAITRALPNDGNCGAMLGAASQRNSCAEVVRCRFRAVDHHSTTRRSSRASGCRQNGVFARRASAGPRLRRDPAVMAAAMPGIAGWLAVSESDN